jgi:hypothetical protein
VNHGCSRARGRNLSNAERSWQLFEQVFYDQLSLAQSLAPKKKLLSLDASVRFRTDLTKKPCTRRSVYLKAGT